MSTVLPEILAWPELAWTMDITVICVDGADPVILPGIPHPDSPLRILTCISFRSKVGRGYWIYFVGDGQPPNTWLEQFFAYRAFDVSVTYPG